MLRIDKDSEKAGGLGSSLKAVSHPSNQETLVVQATAWQHDGERRATGRGMQEEEWTEHGMDLVRG